MKKCGVVLLALAAGLSLAALACKKSGQVVVIGTGHQYEPFCYYDADGELAGLDIAILKEIEKRLPDYSFKFETFDFQNVLVSLAAGKVDVGAHEFEENPQRRETYLFGEEGYNDFDLWLTVKGDGPWADVTSLDDIAGNTNAVIGVSLGSNSEAYVKTWNQNHDADHQLTYQPYTNNQVVNTNMYNGTYAARLATKFDIGWNNALIPGLNLTAAGREPVSISKAYFIFRKDKTGGELQKTFDSALRDMKADGSLEKIRGKILGDFYASL